MSIGFTDGAAAPLRYPNAGAWNRPVAQPGWRIADTAAGRRVFLEWSGDAATLAELQESGLKPGATALPASCGVSLGGLKIILENSDLAGEEGGMATLRAEFRERNERETDSDVAAGLQSRRVGMSWVERQETIEHYVARIDTAASGKFNGALFALWLQEPDPEAKAAFKVTRGDGTQVSLGNTTETDDAWKGSASTLGAAQRFAMGVQYASRHMLQVTAEETWRTPPAVDALCNVVLPDGIPPEHRPLGTLAHFSGRFTWMRVSDGAVPAEGKLHRRTTVYLGVPADMKPADPPALWGDGPVDELLYKTQEGE